MPDVVYFVRDMLFTSKIREVAKQLGLSAQSLPDPAAFAAGASAAKLALVDLRLERALDALDAIASAPTRGTAAIIGFIDHERIDVMETARSRGCTEVLTKGQFAKELPRLLGSVRPGPAVL